MDSITFRGRSEHVPRSAKMSVRDFASPCSNQTVQLPSAQAIAFASTEQRSMTPCPLNPRQLAEEQEENDMTAELFMIGGISIAATYFAAGGDISILSIPGAMLAALVALLKATQERRPWTDKGIVVIGTSVFGSTLPSGIINFFWPDWLAKLTWHVFLLAGFVFGLVGWMLGWAIVLAIDARRDRIAKKVVGVGERRFVGDTESKGGK